MNKQKLSQNSSHLQSPWANRHSPEGPKNLLGALKDGAQSEDALRLSSVIIEPGLGCFSKACVRRRHGKGAPGKKRAQKAWFLAAPENPVQPGKSPCAAVLTVFNVTNYLSLG